MELVRYYIGNTHTLHRSWFAGMSELWYRFEASNPAVSVLTCLFVDRMSQSPIQCLPIYCLRLFVVVVVVYKHVF